MDCDYQKIFKINKQNNTYGSSKITDYFSKIKETTIAQINNLNNNKKIFPLPNSNLAYSTVAKNIQTEIAGYSQKQKSPNIQSEPQNSSENNSKTNNMRIPEYSSQSTISSSSQNSPTLLYTKITTANKYKNNHRFDSDSSSKNSIPNNMRRTKTLKINRRQYYTLNDTTDSDNSTYRSTSTKKSKNSDTSYQPSTNDNSTSSLNKINSHRKNRNMSNKCLQKNLFPDTNNKSNNRTTTYKKFKHNNLRQKNKIIPFNSNVHHHKKTTPPTSTNFPINQHQQKILQGEQQQNQRLTEKNNYTILNSSKKINYFTIPLPTLDIDNNNNNYKTNINKVIVSKNKKTVNARKNHQIVEKNYRSKIMRHLQKIESRFKHDSDHRNQNCNERTRIQTPNKKPTSTTKTRPPKLRKTAKISRTKNIKNCSTYVDTLFPCKPFSLSNKEFPPLDDPT